MKYEVIPSEKFKKEAKRLVKKYPSLKEELKLLSCKLEANPETGTPLCGNIFKIRISIKSKGKGKSGGARVITYLLNENLEVYLLTLYDKSEFDIIDETTLKKIIASITNNKEI